MSESVSSGLDPASILFVNVHKGASTFIADAFATLAAERLPSLEVVRFGSQILEGRTEAELAIPPTNAFFVRVYPGDIKNLVEESPSGEPLSGVKLALMHRDPRDAAVSMYYSMAFSHTTSVRNPDAFLQRREELQTMSVADGVARLAKPVINEFLLINRIAAEHPQCWMSTYEELVGDYDSWIKTFGEFSGWSPADIAAIYEQSHHSFTPPEVEDSSKHIRRISPGNWKEIFDDRLRELFEDQCGEAMAEAGYHW